MEKIWKDAYIKIEKVFQNLTERFQTERNIARTRIAFQSFCRLMEPYQTQIVDVMNGEHKGQSHIAGYGVDFIFIGKKPIPEQIIITAAEVGFTGIGFYTGPEAGLIHLDTNPSRVAIWGAFAHYNKEMRHGPKTTPFAWKFYTVSQLLQEKKINEERLKQ